MVVWVGLDRADPRAGVDGTSGDPFPPHFSMTDRSPVPPKPWTNATAVTCSVCLSIQCLLQRGFIAGCLCNLGNPFCVEDAIHQVIGEETTTTKSGHRRTASQPEGKSNLPVVLASVGVPAKERAGGRQLRRCSCDKHGGESRGVCLDTLVGDRHQRPFGKYTQGTSIHSLTHPNYCALCLVNQALIQCAVTQLGFFTPNNTAQ